MKNRTKHTNTDILKVMKDIVDSHVKHYQSDFDIDTRTLKEAATKPYKEDRTFIWMCRECGTWLLKENSVFISGTREHNTFRFYKEQTRDIILSFAVEVTGIGADTVTGNLYALDYQTYYEHVCRMAVPKGSTIIRYEHGQRILPPSAHFTICPDKELGAFVSLETMPESAEALEAVLVDEKRNRNMFREDYSITGYELYEYPESPTDDGRYCGKTPVREQAETAVRNAGTAGKQLFIKAVCSDGKKRYI